MGIATPAWQLHVSLPLCRLEGVRGVPPPLPVAFVGCGYPRGPEIPVSEGQFAVWALAHRFEKYWVSTTEHASHIESFPLFILFAEKRAPKMGQDKKGILRPGRRSAAVDIHPVKRGCVDSSSQLE